MSVVLWVSGYVGCGLLFMAVGGRWWLDADDDDGWSLEAQGALGVATWPVLLAGTIVFVVGRQIGRLAVWLNREARGGE